MRFALLPSVTEIVPTVLLLPLAAEALTAVAAAILPASLVASLSWPAACTVGCTRNLSPACALPTSVIATPPIFSGRSEEHTSELQSLMRISYAVFCLKKKKHNKKYIKRYT